MTIEVLTSICATSAIIFGLAGLLWLPGND